MSPLAKQRVPSGPGATVLFLSLTSDLSAVCAFVSTPLSNSRVSTAVFLQQLSSRENFRGQLFPAASDGDHRHIRLSMMETGSFW